MSIRDLIPHRQGAVPAARAPDPLVPFHREFDRMLGGFFNEMGFELPARWEELDTAVWPRVNVAESDRDVVVTAELPGIPEKNFTVELDDTELLLRGEIDEQHEERGRRWRRVERRTGRFHRAVPLPAAVVADKVKATFTHGVLTVTLPKRAPVAAPRHPIAIEVE